MPIDRGDLDRAVDEAGPQLTDLARRIHENPELRYEEHKASAWIAETLERLLGVSVERGTGGLPTAFRARVGKPDGPRIAVLAEYDALPEIGHACGHNLIAAGAVGAFVALARHADALPGAVEIIGTPAEEGGAGKVRLLEADVFSGVDAAMMYHPFDRDILAHPALASVWIEMRFTGSPSHAAAAPWDGKSALTACLETFRLIDSQRVHFRDGVRVHGFVTNGGQAVNIIPERASAEFSVRAPTTEELERIRTIVERCARGAALACGVEVALSVRTGYREMVNNMEIARRFGAALEALGRQPRERDINVGAGSTDMGDVSHHVPSIHPYLAICDEGESLCHEHRFAACAASERGYQTMLTAAKAMARTALDLLEDPALLSRAKSEFRAQRPGGSA
jgi:amidohydrolase